MDDLPVIRPPQSADHSPARSDTHSPTQTQSPVSPPASAPVRPPVTPFTRAPERRAIARFSFELYFDQMETLRQFSLDEKLRGEKGSMSEMVREALDVYIATRKGTSS